MECFLCSEADDEDSQCNTLETEDEVLSEDSQEAEGVKSSLLRRARPGLGSFVLVGGFANWLELDCCQQYAH